MGDRARLPGVTCHVTRRRKSERYHPTRRPKLLDVWGGYDGAKIQNHKRFFRNFSAQNQSLVDARRLLVRKIHSTKLFALLGNLCLPSAMSAFLT